MAVCRIKSNGPRAEIRTYEFGMKGRIDESTHADHDLRRLRAEIESALLCTGHLDRMGVRFAFRPRRIGKGVEIEACGQSGETLCSVAPRQLLELVEGGPGDIQMWVMLAGAVELDGADRR